jgi:hypothetical protein
MKAASL